MLAFRSSLPPAVLSGPAAALAVGAAVATGAWALIENEACVYRRGVSPLEWTLFLAAGFLTVYAAAVFALVAAGRRTDARALAGFIPDCTVLLVALSPIRACLGHKRRC